MTKTGLAFSGGGIRSAALCSGVLRRLLHKNVVPDYLSCVSGGGYTGTAYLDWKYRNEQKDDPTWHKEFFDSMRKRVGYLCDWQNPLQGLVDAFSILILVLLLSIIFPCINWFSYAIPTAYIVDHLFGDMLRGSFTCPDTKTHNFTSSEIAENPEVSTFLRKTKEIECVLKLGPGLYLAVKGFGLFFVGFFLLFVIKTLAGQTLRPLATVLFNVTGFALAMTFLPWFIEQFIAVTPMWLNVVILVLSIFLWLGIPLLRDKASIATIIYVYAYVVKWRVYKTGVLSIAYTDSLFNILLWISGILIWMRPLFILSQQSLLHAYNRWRLQKAFYSPESRAATSFLEIACHTAFPLCTCCKGTTESLNRPLTLGDLSGLAPEYICNVTVNHWRLQNSQRKPTFEPLTMSPSRIETIVNEAEGKQFEGRLYPEDIELSEAMATSAAALSYHMGRYDIALKAFDDLQVILGLGFGKSIVADKKKWTRPCFKVMTAVIQLVLGCPILLLPLIPYLGGSEDWNRIAVISFLVIFFLLLLIAVMPTGAENPGCWETFVRWCIVHIFQVRFIREHLGVVNVGPTPPPILYLSDGGHAENLGILPLLKRKLEKIVVINAGVVNEGLGLAHSLFHALNQARDKLRCSFTALDGGDITNDVRAKIVDVPSGRYPRSFRFKVQYFEFTDDGGVEEMVGEGEILYLLPRHPQLGLSEQSRNWRDLADDVKIDIEADLWGFGPAVESEEVDSLTCGCCECCHVYALHRLSGSCCGVFPNHITANQFFTPTMFSAYHREGYRACMEGLAAEFLGCSMNE